MNYDQYLDSLGLTADERKIMDTTARRAAYEGVVTTLTSERDAERTKRTKYEGEVTTWYNAQVEKMSKKDREVIANKSTAARLTAAIKAAKESGVEAFDDDFMKSLGIDGDGRPTVTPPGNNAPPLDASQFYTKPQVDTLAKAAGSYNETIADIQNEHIRLFGSAPKFRELRAEADAAGMGLQAFWEQKYKVADKRQEFANNEVKAREDKIRQEERDKIHNDLLARGVNPDLAAPSTSNNPLRPAVVRGGVRDGSKQPWEYPDQSSERVQRAVSAWSKNPASHGGAAH